MAIVETKILNISTFLSKNELKIPHFQRPYKWTVKNVSQLLEDIQRFKDTSSYRIGTIVIYYDKDNKEYNIVDGQQRTLTFLLIVKALYRYQTARIQNAGLKQQLRTVHDAAFKPTFKSDISKRNIKDNYLEIERRMSIFDESTIDFFLNKCEITHFVIDDVSEAFQFFDSQNARGKDLEPHDLLKAFHLRELEYDAKLMSADEKEKLVDTWEEMDTKELATLFADFLYRVRGWSKGNSSRYFTKKDTNMFKGFNLSRIDHFPYVNIFRIVEQHIAESEKKGQQGHFPFQLDQIIINGKHFFEMITHYKRIYDEFEKNIPSLPENAKQIINTINTYYGRGRTGDKYVRMLFNCALLYYIDKFGDKNITQAIEKIFIWAYTLRLTYESLQLASVDNYVIRENNLFKKIRDAVFYDEIINMNLPQLTDIHKTEAVEEIISLFQDLKYLADEK
jgi:uncharacterized protein with ParB-like and HNH nuclease domain